MCFKARYVGVCGVHVTKRNLAALCARWAVGVLSECRLGWCVILVSWLGTLVLRFRILVSR